MLPKAAAWPGLNTELEILWQAKRWIVSSLGRKLAKAVVTVLVRMHYSASENEVRKSLSQH